MQHVNDDMDELFRRAAEGYPLNTDSADWNAVVKKLELERALPVKKENRNKNYKHLLWLLLLLPLGVYKNYISNANNNKPSETITKKIENKNLPRNSLSKNIKPQFNTTKPVTVAPQKSLAVVINPSPIRRKTKGKLYSKISENNSSTFVPDKTQVLTTDLQNESIQKKEKEYVIEQDNVISENKKETGAIKLNADNKEDDAVKNTEEKTKSAQKKSSIQKQHGLYAGIVVGPDVSTVKFQSIKNIGISMGLLVGYQITNRISLESGVAWNIKNYYSDGKYFNTKNIPSNYNAKIENVDGICNMIEVPIAIKYNITTGKTHFSITDC